jgi:uroporphyrinogen decarboxylase
MVDRVDSETSPFLAACRRRPTDRTPVWLMRQAGRYMREYRELRQKYGMLDIIKQPELSCQVTLQPIDAFALDAAIIFADLLPPLEALGLKVGFEAGEGPIIYNPVRDETAVRSLSLLDVEEATWFTLEAIRLVSRELAGRGIPLIGFSGAPFTLACYAVEGGTSKDYPLAKRLLMERPDLWRSLMSKLSELVTGYLRSPGSGRRAGSATVRHLGRPPQPHRLPGVRAALQSRDSRAGLPGGRAHHLLLHRDCRYVGAGG